MPAAKQPRPASHFKLTLGGKESAGVFREISGLDNETDVVEHKYVDEQGKQTVRKVAGSNKWSNLSLKRGVDNDLTLWKWRQQVIDGDLDGARTDGQIQLLDYKGEVISTYKFLQGWPIKYSGGTLSATSNEVALEEIQIAHEGLERA
jgi:phage tail-like protein